MLSPLDEHGVFVSIAPHYRVINLSAIFYLGFTVLSAQAAKSLDDRVEYAAPDSIEEVLVWGRSTAQKGTALSSSQGLVGYADFSTRPLLRIGEIVEVVPGMVATQHSGEGKANQYYLRGMNLDHGTDFSTYFEGMPINLRSHAHGHGYLDLNFLIPEIISTLAYQKGPYFPERGDFSTAASSSVYAYDRVEHSFIKSTTGDFGYKRILGVLDSNFDNYNAVSALEVTRNDGPWSVPSNVKKTNALTKLTGLRGDYVTKIVLTYYDNQWRATDQVPARSVKDGSISRFGTIDPTLVGRSNRKSLIIGAESENLAVSAYVSDYALNLFGNFTYFADDPVNGDQHEQEDRRQIYGANISHEAFQSKRLNVSWGADFRYDRISASNLYQTTQRLRRETRRDDNVDWLSFGNYLDIEKKLSESFRASFGLRLDVYDFEVVALNPLNSGKGREHKLTPNLNLAYEIGETTEVYLNWGRGFHSNDVRGVTINVDPATGLSADAVNLFVGQTGAEIGLRIEQNANLNASMTYFWLESDSELMFVGDSGATEPGLASQRTGLEANLFWRFNPSWTIDALASLVESEYRGLPGGANSIPNAPGKVFGAGLTYHPENSFSASIRLRHFGDTPVVEDDSVSNKSTTLINAGIGYKFQEWDIELDVLNLLDSEDNDIAYFFESKLSTEAIPVEDVHFHPATPRSYRLTVKYNFGRR
jgi:hypothetical protein